MKDILRDIEKILKSKSEYRSIYRSASAYWLKPRTLFENTTMGWTDMMNSLEELQEELEEE